MVGTTISHYRILEKIGEGGMGLVFKAQDTRLDRTVALKFLSSTTVDDVGKKRFYREAHTAASLNHPNIAYVFNIEEHAAQSFITMEFVEGRTVQDILRDTGKPLPIKKAIDYAIQIATGLDAAHKKNIIHRDIKSANIMLAPGEQIKIMDFGLAKLTDETMVTKIGTRMGTVAYMSPEQAEGADVDYRSDLWSLGVLLYEMITGQLPFKGDAEQAVIYSILKEDPQPLTGLRTGVPMELERIVLKAPEKNPAERYQHADELLADLRVLLSRYNEFERGYQRGRRLGKKIKPSSIVVAAVSVFTLIALLLSQPWQSTEITENNVVRFSFDIPNGFKFAANSYYPSLAISPDGQRIAYAATNENESQVFVRNLNESESVPLPGGKFAGMPFFSPDGSKLGFKAADTLKTVSLNTGATQNIYIVDDEPRFGAADWYDDHSILLDKISLWKMSTEGGEPIELNFTPKDTLIPEVKQSSPQMLPDQKSVLVTLKSEMEHLGDIAVMHLKTGEIDTLLQANYARYIPTGHLIYAKDDDLYAVGFDVKNSRIVGPHVRVVENVAMHKAAAQFAVSETGTLVYATGGQFGDDNEENKLVFVSPDGQVQDSHLPIGDYNMPRLSPDESKLAYWRNGRHYIYDFQTGKETALTESHSAGYTQTWLPDGQNLLINAYYHKTGYASIYKIPLDGIFEPVRLTFNDSTYSIPYSVTPDGSRVLYLEFPDVYVENISFMALPLAGADSLQPYPIFPKKAITPALSPDGQWLAYVSEDDDSQVREKREIAVRPFNLAGRVYKLGEMNTSEPMWSADGKTLYYRAGRRGQKIMAVPIRTEPEFSFGQPKLLFQGDYHENSWWWANYCIASDGTIIIIQKKFRPLPTKLHVVLNWFEELRAKMAAEEESQLLATYNSTQRSE